jgi:hypothetical protein
MNTRRIAAEIAGVRVYPSDRRAALANDFGERDEVRRQLFANAAS